MTSQFINFFKFIKHRIKLKKLNRHQIQLGHGQQQLNTYDVYPGTKVYIQKITIS